MINTVVLTGRLTKDPELKYTQSGIAICRFTLAVNRMFTNEQGQREADFINCITWRKQAENTANYLRKGSLAGIEGRIQTSSFDGKDGNRVFVTEVVANSVQFLEPKNNNTQNAPNNANTGYQEQANTNTPNQTPNISHGQHYANSNGFNSGNGNVEVGDEDLPF